MVRTGSLTAAAQVCGKILQQVPEQPKALYLLAMVALQKGRQDEGAELLRRSIKADPTFATALNDLGSLLSLHGEFAEAEACYRQAIASAPKFAEAHTNLGNLLQITDFHEPTEI